ncbi:GNAT family N-acetyltransferase [Microbacteriaceae bacterium VKM Ac-2855]|nr:GNAT family N-acetyltransferase [Microbacteriaceae bacterium VKM Ac-2855]
MTPWEQAATAQERAQVRVSVADFDDLRELITVFEQTWGVGYSPDEGLLHALGHAGNTVLIARDRHGTAVGGALGFLGWSDGLHLHSHMAAVSREHRAGGVGAALKITQRAICLDHGVTEMRWTFDPLIRRNAYFNLVKLGAVFAAFHLDFYGQLDDLVSGGDQSDRAEVSWRLDSPRVLRALAGEAAPEWTGRGFALLPDFESSRSADPAAIAPLRRASRIAFTQAFAAGLRPELDRDRDYVFTAEPAD